MDLQVEFVWLGGLASWPGESLQSSEDESRT